MLISAFILFIGAVAIFHCGIISIKTKFSDLFTAYCFFAFILLVFLIILLILELVK